jgi:dGTPase
MRRQLFRLRETLERDEHERLSPLATRSSEAVRRHPETTPEAEDYRLAFQRDRDRITHSRAFRRLKHKTQVFVPHVADHPRTRLTHTLEVAQLARTIARALGLNEDLVEAVALGHDLGHTAFGHTGESVLKDILRGNDPVNPMPPEVIGAAGTFKHNYQSVRTVDLLERCYELPGLNLTDQVREGILKHTSWTVDLSFPLPDEEGLRLGGPCHLEGQAVAVADEIAQQTHDLEDGLRVESVRLRSVEELEVSRRVIAGLDGGAYSTLPRWRRQSTLLRGLISFFVTDVITTSATRLSHLLAEAGHDPTGDEARRRLTPAGIVDLSEDAGRLFGELKAFIYRYIINHWQVSRQDWRARKVLGALFRAFWVNPLTLPTYVLLRARDELGFPYIRDLPLGHVAAEITNRYHASPGFARLLVDHLAGMSDRFALEEFHSLEQPDTGQRFVGEER